MNNILSIGVMAHNEEANIGRLLEFLAKSKVKDFPQIEIIVVSSGSTDRTNQIVKDLTSKYANIKLITQKKRLGKATAVNIFLKKARGSILVLASADLIPKKKTLNLLVSHFSDLDVGIVGAHPMPINDKNTFMGYASHLLWELHHRISLANPKMGEMIAFRKIFKKIANSSPVDEVNIEVLVRCQGYKAIYAHKAIVYNKGPESISEFVTYRRRIYAGHLMAKDKYGYAVSTLSGFKVFITLLSVVELNFKYLLWTILVICLEIWSRILGFLDYKYNLKNHAVWQIAPSTKKL